MSFTIAPASIALSEPTIAVTVVASVFLTIFMAAMVFLALAPVVSDRWQSELGGSTDATTAADPATAD